jgi:glycosyltransferase involved in cell wall biosynthesis
MSTQPGSQDRLRAISFVIPAYNEELLLPRTLDSIHAAARALRLNYEIVVADDASTDQTARVAREKGARVISVQNRQISATRNAGARAATGGVLIFVDADTVVPVGPMEEALGVIAAGGIAGGAACAFDGSIPAWARVVMGSLLVLYRWARLSPGAFLFSSRDAFEAVGGFDESVFGGEEVLLARALDRFAKARGRRFTVVRSPIITSGRKLRAYRGRELLVALARVVVRGRRGARQRAGFEMWYGPRRNDPGTPPAPGQKD